MTAACPFCGRIKNGEFDYSDDYNVAFQPLNPVTPGHFLVVPTRHVSNALESPSAAGRALQFAGYLANQMGLGAANSITPAAGTPRRPCSTCTSTSFPAARATAWCSLGPDRR